MFARYGIPESIHSDCGQQFMSKLFREVGEALNIQVTTTTGYNPKGNGQVERMHRDLNTMLRTAVMDDDHESWEDALAPALFALRTHTSSSTGLTPYQILFGRDVSQPLDTIFGDPEKRPETHANEDPRAYASALKHRLIRANAYVRRNLELSLIHISEPTRPY